MTKARPVRVRNLIAYGLGDIFGGGSFVILNIFFVFFLTEVVGLTPGLASVVFGIGKVWDAISDPLMGYLSDRTRSRFGRRRVYFLIGIVPIAVSFTVLWVPLGEWDAIVYVAYYGLTYVFFSTVFTMVMVPYSALNAEMTPDYEVRTRLSGVRIVFSLCSALLAATAPEFIIKAHTDVAMGHFWMAAIFGLVFALPWFVVFWGTWETPCHIQQGESLSVKQVFVDFFSLARNRSFRVHVAMYVCAFTAMDCLMFLFKYYLHWVIGRPESFALTMGSLMAAEILTLGGYVALANRFGKGVAFRIGMGVWGVGMLFAMFLDSETPLVWVVLVCVLIGCGLSAAVMVPWAILPSIVDVDELITGRQRAGAYSGATTLLRKMAQGLFAMPLIGISLEMIGYVEKAQSQAPETLDGLRMLFPLAPLSLIVVGFAVSFFFRINPQTHRVLRQELERLRAGGDKAAVDSETRAVAETLTGMPYEQLYR